MLSLVTMQQKAHSKIRQTIPKEILGAIYIVARTKNILTACKEQIRKGYDLSFFKIITKINQRKNACKEKVMIFHFKIITKNTKENKNLNSSIIYYLNCQFQLFCMLKNNWKIQGMI